VSLGAYTMEQLWDEIVSRTDAAVLVTQVKMVPNDEERLFYYHGGITAIGLAHLADRRLLDNYISTSRNFGGEEETAEEGE